MGQVTADVRYVPKADMTDLPYAGIKRGRRALLPVASLVAVGPAIYCATSPVSACTRVTGGGFHFPVSTSDLGA